MKGSPTMPDPNAPGSDVQTHILPAPVVREELPVPEPRPEKVMPFVVRHKDALDYGYTARCKGCRAAQRGHRYQAHSEECRQRTLKALQETGAGRERIARTVEHQWRKRAR